MSNPYSAPEMPLGKPTNPTGGDVQVPGGLKAISIICLVLGILGLLGFCGNVAAIGMQSFSASIIEKMPDDDPNTQFQKTSLEFQKSIMIPTIIMVVFGLIASAGLTIGSIGALKRQASLHGWFKISLYLSAAYSFVYTGWGCWINFTQMGNIDQMAAGGVDPQAAEIFKTGFYFALIAGIVVAVVWGLGWMAFYLWSASYIGRPNIKAFFNK